MYTHAVSDTLETTRVSYYLHVYPFISAIYCPDSPNGFHVTLWSEFDAMSDTAMSRQHAQVALNSADGCTVHAWLVGLGLGMGKLQPLCTGNLVITLAGACHEKSVQTT
jgi:hypothetical protein